MELFLVVAPNASSQMLRTKAGQPCLCDFAKSLQLSGAILKDTIYKLFPAENVHYAGGAGGTGVMMDPPFLPWISCLLSSPCSQQDDRSSQPLSTWHQNPSHTTRREQQFLFQTLKMGHCTPFPGSQLPLNHEFHIQI